MGDGPQSYAEHVFENSNLPGRYIECKTDHKWGNMQRNQGILFAQGKYILFMDDDDAYAPGAFDSIRSLLDFSSLNLFRMIHNKIIGIIWRSKQVQLGNVSSQIIVVPNEFSKLSKWQSLYEGDFLFARDCEASFGNVNWCEPIISMYRVGKLFI